MDLERRLVEGPLPVRPLWSAEQTTLLPLRVLRARRRQVLVRGGVGVFALTTALAGLWLWWPSARALEARGSTVALVASSAPVEGSRRLLDGSQVSVLGPDSRIEVLEDTARLVRVRLSAGGARFDVRPESARVFEAESGDVRVTVLGTIFSLARAGALTRVAVEHGLVRVQWLGGQALLSAGQTGLYPPPASDVVAIEKELVAATEPPVEHANGAPGDAVMWRKLAKRGAYADAYRAIGPSSSKNVRDEPADLMLAADVARLSRHPVEASGFLRRVSDGFSGDRRAPLAAFTLGRVLLEDLGQPARAADAFQRAHQLAPRGPLASDALAREVEAAQRAGQGARAKAVARRYVELYPVGQHAERLRRL